LSSQIFMYHCLVSGFFLQAEDGIRDRNVTGVQTCALPILLLAFGVELRQTGDQHMPLPELFDREESAVFDDLLDHGRVVPGILEIGRASCRDRLLWMVIV